MLQRLERLAALRRVVRAHVEEVDGEDLATFQHLVRAHDVVQADLRRLARPHPGQQEDQEDPVKVTLDEVGTGRPRLRATLAAGEQRRRYEAQDFRVLQTVTGQGRQDLAALRREARHRTGMELRLDRPLEEDAQRYSVPQVEGRRGDPLQAIPAPVLRQAVASVEGFAERQRATFQAGNVQQRPVQPLQDLRGQVGQRHVAVEILHEAQDRAEAAFAQIGPPALLFGRQEPHDGGRDRDHLDDVLRGKRPRARRHTTAREHVG